MNPTPDPIQRGLELLREVALEQPGVAAELEASARGFFGDRGPSPDPQQARLAGLRHLEWFLLERHSPALRGTPVERTLERWRERAEDEEEDGLADTGQALLESSTGIYEVTDVRAGEGMWLRDMAGFGEYALSEPEGTGAVQPHDLIVGRLFPVGGGLHRASLAARFVRDPGLLDALERDLEHLRQSGTAKVLHLSQRELESMFWGPGEPGRVLAGAAEIATVPDPVGEVRRLLLDAGLEETHAEALLARLAGTPLDREQLAVGAQDAVGHILDELAFDTPVDLDRARALLSQAWSSLRGEEGAAEPTEAAPEARSAVDAFARGRAAGGDLDTLLAQLERELELPPDAVEADTDEEGTEREPTTPDFPGVVGAMIDEFLWEVGEQHGRAPAGELRCLGLLASFAAPLGLLEELDAAQLLRFLAFWVHERGALRSAPDARELLDALEAFCTWAEEAHELPLRSDFAATLAALRESLPRIVEANHAVQPEPANDPGELYELRAAGEGAVLRNRAGDDRPVSMDPALLAHLRDGDRMRAAVSSAGVARVFRCYPPEAVGLLERR